MKKNNKKNRKSNAKSRQNNIVDMTKENRLKEVEQESNQQHGSDFASQIVRVDDTLEEANMNVQTPQKENKVPRLPNLPVNYNAGFNSSRNDYGLQGVGQTGSGNLKSMGVMQGMSPDQKPSEKNTQIVQKVEQIFYWYNDDGQQEVPKIVEIQGDFTMWKSQQMRPLKNNPDILDENNFQTKKLLDQGATHYLRKVLDNKQYDFKFIVNGQPKVSNNYEKSVISGHNKIDLKSASTKLFVKKKQQKRPQRGFMQSPVKSQYQSVNGEGYGENNSQYETFSRFIENEQDELEKDEGQDTNSSYEEIVRLDPDELEDDSEINLLNKQINEDQHDLRQRGHYQSAQKQFIPSRFNQIERETKDLDLDLQVIEGSPEVESPSQTLKNSLLDDHFKVELENVVIQNSPPKEGKNTGRNRDSKAFEFNLMQVKDESSDEDYKSAKSGKDKKVKQNNFVNDDEVDSDAEEQIDINKAAEEIFNNLFLETFDQNLHQKNKDGRVYITQEQFKQSANDALGLNDDTESQESSQMEQLTRLMNLYDLADPKNIGQVTQNQLMEAIKQDYQKNLNAEDLSMEESSDEADNLKKEQLGLKQSNSVTENQQRRLSLNDGVSNSRASRLSKKEVQKHKLKLKFNEKNENVENEDNPEIEFYHGQGDSNRDQIDDINMNMITYEVPTKPKRKVNRMKSTLTAEQKMEKHENQMLEDSPNQQNEKEIIGTGYQKVYDSSGIKKSSGRCQHCGKNKEPLISAFQLNSHHTSPGTDSLSDKGQQQNFNSDHQSDPILQQLKLINDKDLSIDVRCGNLKQTLEYIYQNKLAEYSQDSQSLEHFVMLLIENQEVLQQEFENQQNYIDELEQKGTTEVQEYQEMNQELEGELDQMTGELEKLKMYETQYHIQEKKLKNQMDRVDQLQQEKDNIETAHLDLINEFSVMRKQLDADNMELKKFKLENAELTGQIGNLKQSIINQYSKKKKDNSFIEQVERQQEYSPTIIYKEEEDEDDMSSDSDGKSQPREVQVVDDSSSSENINTNQKDQDAVLNQDNPTEDNLESPKENSKQKQQSFEEKQQIQEALMKEEQTILDDLETTNVYDMRQRIKNYIENNVRLNRAGQNLTIQKQADGLQSMEKNLKKQLFEQKFTNEELQRDIKTTRFLNAELETQVKDRDRELYAIKLEFQSLMKENQELNDQKVRIMGVNQMLEQKISVEKSEMMSIQNDLENVVRVNMGMSQDQQDDVYSSYSMQRRNRKMGQMSSYIRKTQNAIRSMKGSQYGGVNKKHHNAGGKPQNPAAMAFGNDLDNSRDNQKRFMKYQTKKHMGHQGQYREEDGTSSYMMEYDNQSMSITNQDIVIDDHSDQTSVIVTRQYGNNFGDRVSNYSRSNRARQKIMRNAARQTSIRGGSAYSYSMRGSVKSGSQFSGVDGRVHVIQDFDSDDESIAEFNQNDLDNINDQIKEREKNELIQKRKDNVYDMLKLSDENNEFYDFINKIMESNHKQEQGRKGHSKRRSKNLVQLKNANEKEIYSELIKVFVNKVLKNAILLIFKGLVYIFQVDENIKNPFLFIQPFNFLDDLQKIIYSEVHEKFLALRLRDLRKGNRDHVIIEIKDREILADFIMEYAEQEEDEIIFEQNEEFSMIVNSSPMWFSFDDVQRSKKVDVNRQFKSQDLTGFLEQKQNKAIDIFKMIFSKQAGWLQRYFALKSTKLYVYEGVKYNKPLQIIELTEDMKVSEIRRGDAGGKDYVFTITPAKDKEPTWLCASSEDQLNKWIKALGAIKDQFMALKQQQIDKLKEEVVVHAIKKERASTVFQSNNQSTIKKEMPIQGTTIDNEILENDEEEDDNDEEVPFDMSNLMAQETSRSSQNQQMKDRISDKLKNEVQQRLKYFEDKKKEEEEKKRLEEAKNKQNLLDDGWKTIRNAMKFQSKVSIIIEEPQQDGFSDSNNSNINLASRNSHLAQNSTAKKSNHSRQGSNSGNFTAMTPTEVGTHRKFELTQIFEDNNSDGEHLDRSNIEDENTPQKMENNIDDDEEKVDVSRQIIDDVDSQESFYSCDGGQR